MVALSGKSVPADPQGLAETILSTTPVRGGAWEGAVEASAGMPGIAKIKGGLKRKPAAAAAMGVKEALAAHSAATGRKPVLVTMDEAHSAPPEALGALLDAAQDLNRGGVPAAVVLAGTPDLMSALRKAGATWFLDRAPEARLVPVGNLAAADCAATVAAPLDALKPGVRPGRPRRRRRMVSGQPLLQPGAGAGRAGERDARARGLRRRRGGGKSVPRQGGTALRASVA